MRWPRPLRSLTLGGVCALAACAHAPPRPRVAVEFDDAGLRRELATIASARFDGRRPGTAGAHATVAYLAGRLGEFGLKPAFGDSYTQQVPLVELRPAVAPRLAFSPTGKQGAAIPIAYPSGMLLWTPRESGSGSLHASRVVFVGYGIDSLELNRHDYAGADVRGRTVLVLDGLPPGVSTAGRSAIENYGLARYKFAEAARHGARGVLLLQVDSPAAEPWSALMNRYTGGLIEAPAADGHASEPLVEGWLSASAARQVFSAAGENFAVAAARAQAADFRALDLGLEAQASVRETVRRFDSQNVAAFVKGRRHPRECVLYSAHWDQLGRVSEGGRTAALPGAVDDATGVAGLLLLAQRFARAEPQRSIVFLATTAGEYGSLGAAWYADHPRCPLTSTVADIDLEMLHVGGPTRDVSSFAFGESQLDHFLVAAADLQGRLVHGDPQPMRLRFARSDAAVFAGRGLPSLYAIGGPDDAAMGPVWGGEQVDRYFSRAYLRPADRYLPTWDVRGTLEDLRLYFAVGIRLASIERFPDWRHGQRNAPAREN